MLSTITTDLFFANQRRTGASAVNKFYRSLLEDTADRRVNCCLLHADVQSGKTGTYNFIAKAFLHERSPFGVTKVYIVCGSNDVGLYEQAKEDCAYYNRPLYATRKIEVIFRNNFEKYLKEEGEKLQRENSLWIIDESHMDQTKGSELDQLLTKYGISAYGTTAKMVADNNWYISVDATPYSELSVIKHGESLPKFCVRLPPGDGYYGIRDYHRAGLLRNRPINFSSKDEVRTVLRKVLSHCDSKYAVIRSHGKTYAMLKELLSTMGVPTHEYISKNTSMKKRDFVRLLKTSPSERTVVLVDGRLRAGEVVPKKYVGAVWETSSNANTDVIIQGLFGRMCGYKFGSGKPVIYLSLKRSHFKDLENVILHNRDARKATNILKGKSRDHAIGDDHQCVPIRIDVGMHDDDGRVSRIVNHRASERDIRSEISAMVLDNEAFILRNPHLTEEQRSELRSRISSIRSGTYDELISIRRLHGTSQLGYYDDLLRANYEGTVTREHITGCPYITGVVIQEGYIDARVPAGTVFLQLYTDAPNTLARRPLSFVCGKENGKSIFRYSTIDVTMRVTENFDDRSLSGAFWLPADAFDSPEAFHRNMERFIRFWREDPDHTSSVISSMTEPYRFCRSAFEYESRDRNEIERLLKEIGREYDCTFVTKYRRSGSTHFTINEIAWVDNKKRMVASE